MTILMMMWTCLSNLSGDKAAKVAKMRRNLQEDNEGNLKFITQKSEVHLSHLLAKDLNTSSGVKENVEFAEYFCNITLLQVDCGEDNSFSSKTSVGKVDCFELFTVLRTGLF